MFITLKISDIHIHSYFMDVILWSCTIIVSPTVCYNQKNRYRKIRWFITYIGSTIELITILETLGKIKHNYSEAVFYSYTGHIDLHKPKRTVLYLQLCGLINSHCSDFKVGITKSSYPFEHTNELTISFHLSIYFFPMPIPW